MYKIMQQKFGILLTFSGFIDTDELTEWYRESEQILQTIQNPFGVIVDMRSISPISVHSRELFTRGQQLYHKRGMQRSAVIVKNAVALMQFKQVAISSGIYQWERYIDADTNPDWLESALLWVHNGINPTR